jgi:glucose/arabinose dehydrogenase
MARANRNILLVIAFILLLLIGIAVTQLENGNQDQPREPVPEENENSSTQASEETVITEDLDVPWGIEFLPEGDMLVTERPGTLLRMERGQNGFTERYQVEGVEHRGEGGLLGVEKHPNYTENNYVYLYMTTEVEGGLRNRVVRYELNGTELSNPTTIIDGLPGAIYHDGGRIEFGPDSKLYVAAGDATNEDWAQDTDRLAGKILRLNSDGSIPEDNPFDNEVYTYGLRNSQGLVWIDDQLWAIDHGDTRHDELNRIERGENYGWPEIEADQNREGMRQPEIYADDTTWAPAGAAYTDGSIYFSGLRGQTLYEAEIEDGEVTNLNEHLDGEYGRLRAVELGPEGDLYVSTSNADGRGTPASNDDRIIRVDPENIS